MTDKNWDPDDLLDFHYDHPAPKKEEAPGGDFDIFDEFDALEDHPAYSAPKSTGKGLDTNYDSYSDYKRYEALRSQSHKDAPAEGSVRSFDVPEPFGRARHESEASIFEQYDNEHSAVHDLVEETEPQRPLPSLKEIEAIKQASKEAQDRYKSNYVKGRSKRAEKGGISGWQRVLTVIYTVAMAAFVGSMTVMDVMPAGMLTAMYVVLALLSILLLFQTRKRGIKTWVRRMATVLAVLLVFVYGAGTVYALGTLSFLKDTSVDNDKAVAGITKEPFNVVITGMDVTGEIDEQGRSDVNMILTVNPETATVLMTSIPRDYEIYMPDHDYAMDKLTHTGFYSVDTTILAEEDLLDITANYYVKVNFTTVEKFIDAIGGVDVYSEYEFNPVKMKDWTVKEGMNHMNGKQALAFARERKAFITGDNQRIKNQQAVFEAMFKKATSSRTIIFSYYKILSELKPYFEMSFSSHEIRQLCKMQLTRFPDWGIYKNTIVGGDGNLYTYTAGYAYVMTQDQTSIENAKSLINAVMDGKALAKDDDGMAYISDEEQTEE